MSNYSVISLVCASEPLDLEQVLTDLFIFLKDKYQNYLFENQDLPRHLRAYFMALEDTQDKFVDPQGMDISDLQPTSLDALIHLAKKYADFSITVNLLIGQVYFGTKFLFLHHNGQYSVRVSIDSQFTQMLYDHEYLFSAKNVNPELKAEAIALCVGLSARLKTPAFLFGLEEYVPFPVQAQEVVQWLLNPELQDSKLLHADLVGIYSTLIDKQKLADLWKAKEHIKESTAGYLLMDRLGLLASQLEAADSQHHD